MGMAISVPRYTVDDLERFPNDGNRYELLDGVLIVTPAPQRAHQLVASRIMGQLLAALHGVADVVGPGVIVRLPGTQLEPDVLVQPARFAHLLRWVDVTEHWLAVEVLSRSSRIYDREFKRDAYFALGVQQVWLVDIEDRSVEVWSSRSEPDIVRDVIRWRVPTTDLVVAINLAGMFPPPAPRP
jgi:Uma2 family endonuclease